MDLLEHLRGRTDEMVAALRALVEVESPTSDPRACAACVEAAQKLAIDLIGDGGEQIAVGDRTHVRWRFGTPKVALIGHLDTVWPVGTLARWPFTVDGDNATGPGCFDMKVGVVQLFYALAGVQDLAGVTIVLTTDEEVGGPASRDLIRESVAGCSAALVLEPSADGSLKTQRKGTSSYRIHVTGRAAHAGLDPEKGVNAAVEIAHQILAVAALADADRGTTVTPSVLTAGTTTNTVPGAAILDVDVRAFSAEEQQRIEDALNELEPVLPNASLRVERRALAPPLERSSSQELFAHAQRVAGELGLPPLSEAAVGGGSDGNFIASLGIPTLDGLGAVGANAHAEGERVTVSAMPERAALVSALTNELRRG